jgi:hypothetical protein
MEPRRKRRSGSGPPARTSPRQSEPRREPRWLGSRESGLVREVRRYLRAPPPAFDECGFSVDNAPLIIAEQLRPARDRLRRMRRG